MEDDDGGVHVGPPSGNVREALEMDLQLSRSDWIRGDLGLVSTI